MRYRVILERDGIFRSVELEGCFQVKALRGEQVFNVDARDRLDALKKAGKLWRLPDEGEAMSKKVKKPVKKPKKTKRPMY